MSSVFLDTSGIVAVINRRDQWHADASAVWTELLKNHIPLVTTSLVLVEIADALSRLRFRQSAIQTVSNLRQSSHIKIVSYSSSLDQRAWDLYKSRSDKEWGFTDCASMVVMSDLKLLKIFSADRHFSQAGFQLLLEQMD